VKRRTFIAGLGSAAAWPMVARGQQTVLPLIGLLYPGASDPNQIAAFRQGLVEAGYAEGRNVAIELRFAQGDSARFPELVADLVRRKVAVVAVPGSTPAALAAKAATTQIPVVFGNASDPVQIGLVSSLNRPGGNVTGFSEMNAEVAPKRLALLRMLVPTALRFGVLVNPNNPLTRFAAEEARAASDAIGVQIETFNASSDRELDEVFASVVQKPIGGLLVTPEALFYIRRVQLAMLAAQYAIPAIYWDRALVEAGGLISYGSSVLDMNRQVARYVGRILNGETPSELPILRPTKFELSLNLKTAKALGLTIPETLLATADEVIQ
jgi:putative tryptophan/tyrosine transport system substrate-binding protein